jgi:hypothetical protein
MLLGEIFGHLDRKVGLYDPADLVRKLTGRVGDQMDASLFINTLGTAVTESLEACQKQFAGKLFCIGLYVISVSALAKTSTPSTKQALLHDANFYAAHLARFQSLLTLFTRNRVTFPRLILDDTKLPIADTRDSNTPHNYLPLPVSVSQGNVEFMSLPAQFFEVQDFRSKFDAKELVSMRAKCSALSPPVQQTEDGKMQLRMMSTPDYLLLNPLIYAFKMGAPSGGVADAVPIQRKAVNISMPLNIDVRPFLDISIASTEPVIYELTDVVVHVGKAQRQGTRSQRQRSRDRDLQSAAASGHYVLYTKLNENTWYSQLSL